MGGARSSRGKGEKCIQNFGQKSRPLRRPRHRWEDNVRMDLREIKLEGVDWICSGLGPVVGSYEYGNEPSGYTKGGDFLD